MARGERAESGQRAPGPAAAAAAAGAACGEDSRRPSAPPHSPRAPRAAPAAPARLRGGRDQRPAPPPPAPTAGLRGPHPSRLLEPHRGRRKRTHLERSRRAAGTEARGAASPVAAAARGVAEKAPFSGAVRACCPAPRSRCPPAGPRPRALPAPRLDARSLGFPLRHRRGRRQVSAAAASPAHGHRPAGGGGPRVRPGGGVRRRLEGRGRRSGQRRRCRPGDYFLQLAPGLGTARSERPAEGDAGGVWGGRVAAPGRGGGPRRTMHLGVKPRLRGSGPRPAPSASRRRRGRSHKGRACPRGPSPAGLFRIGEGGGGAGRDGAERRGRAGDFSPMAPAHPPLSLSRRGPVEGKPTNPTSEICQLHWRHLRVMSPTFGDGSYPPWPHRMQHWLKHIPEECPKHE